MTDLLTFIEATKGTSLKIEVTSKELLERYGIRMKGRMDETFDLITFSNQSYRKQV